MTDPSLPQFEAAQRREFLKRAAQLGAVVLVPGALAACSSKGHDSVFASTTAAATTATTTTAAAAGSESTTTAPGAPSGAALPDGAKLEVAFTFSATAGGPDRNPFIAVWIESAAGDLVANISLWYNPPKGDRWVHELSNWYAADSAYYDANGSDDTAAVTGATRAAGASTVVWDGVGDGGDRAPQGDYVVFVESAQEHGTHSLISTPITLGSSAVDATFPDDGDLSAASATYTT